MNEIQMRLINVGSVTDIWDLLLFWMKLQISELVHALLLVLFMLLKNTEKILLDRNPMYSFTIYRSLLPLLLFTVYTITIYCYTILLLSLHSSNLDNMNID